MRRVLEMEGLILTGVIFGLGVGAILIRLGHIRRLKSALS
jgi:hypothetical protein